MRETDYKFEPLEKLQVPIDAAWKRNDYHKYGKYHKYNGYNGCSETWGDILKWLFPILIIATLVIFFKICNRQQPVIPAKDEKVNIEVKKRGEGYSRVYTEYDANGNEITDLKVIRTFKLKGHYYVNVGWSRSVNSTTPMHDPDCTHESHNIYNINNLDNIKID